jgi:hypothetical protein
MTTKDGRLMVAVSPDEATPIADSLFMIERGNHRSRLFHHVSLIFESEQIERLIHAHPASLAHRVIVMADITGAIRQRERSGARTCFGERQRRRRIPESALDPLLAQSIFYFWRAAWPFESPDSPAAVRLSAAYRPAAPPAPDSQGFVQASRFAGSGAMT